jgi:hypothetical protein
MASKIMVPKHRSPSTPGDLIREYLADPELCLTQGELANRPAARLPGSALWGIAGKRSAKGRSWPAFALNSWPQTRRMTS